MSKNIILQDRIIQTGISPVYDQDYNDIAHIHYHFFNLRGKIEVKSTDGELLTYGSAKLLTLLPKWFIYSPAGEVVGQINRKFTLIKKEYEYINQNGEVFTIKGDIWSRKFKVYKGNVVAVDVDNLSNFISLRPHTFLIQLIDDSFTTWEAISVIQGVRSLVKREQERARNNNR